MIRNYYKKHIALGVLFFVIVFGLVFINLEGTSHDFYWILYNRSYATILYIPLFFGGMIWLFSDFFFQNVWFDMLQKSECWKNIWNESFFFLCIMLVYF